MTTNFKLLCRINRKGQINIPPDMLTRLGVKVGDYLRIEEEGPNIVLIPAKNASDMVNRDR